MNEMVVSSCVDVHVCLCFTIAYFFWVYLITMFLVFQGVSPWIPIDFWWFFNYPISKLPHFPHLSLFFFPVSHVSFCFYNWYVSCFPMCLRIQTNRSVVVFQFSHLQVSHFLLYFPPFFMGGGVAYFGPFSPQPPLSSKHQTHIRHQTSSWIHCTHHMPHQAPDTKPYTQS